MDPDIDDALAERAFLKNASACWAMWFYTPELATILIKASAFVYAANQGWIPPGDLPGEALPGDLPHVNEKLRTRRLFIDIISSHPEPEEAEDELLFQAMNAAPRNWLKFRTATNFVQRKLGWTNERLDLYPKLEQILAGR